MRLKIKFNEFAQVNKFNSIVSEFKSDIDIISGKYIIDAKSLMALYTMDLSKELDVEIYNINEEELKLFEVAMKEFAA